MNLLEHLAINGHPLKKITGQTTNGVAGTRSNHTHGLVDRRGKAVTPTIAIPVPTATDADGALTALDIRVVALTSTVVTVRASSTAVSIPFDLYVG